MSRFKYSPVAWAALTAVVLGTMQAQAQSVGQANEAKNLEAVTVIGTLDDLQSLDFYAPNSSTVLKRDDIEAQGARKVDQALQYQAGIQSENYGGDNKVEWFRIRGFEASTALDGTPTTPNAQFWWVPEVYGLESVEVLKGANSLQFGAASAGGVVNLVTKRPQKEQSLAFDLEAGNFNKRGLGLDYNGIANDDGTVYYRLVAQARHEDGQQTGTELDSYYFAPSVTVEVSPRTTLTLLASLQYSEGVPTSLFLPANGTVYGTANGYIDRSTFLGEPDRDHTKREQSSISWLLSHKFDNNWTFTQNYRYSHLDLDLLTTYYSWGTDPTALNMDATYADGTTDNHYIDNRFSTTLRLGNVELSPAVGVDYLHSETKGLYSLWGNTVPVQNAFAPVYGQQPYVAAGKPYEQQIKQMGVYASGRLQVGQNWNFNAGIRHDDVRQKSLEDVTAKEANLNHDSFNLGAMYMSSFGVAPYIGYSESFKPQLGTDTAGNDYKPYEGRQTEVGVKLQPAWLPDGTITFAFFDLEEKNALVNNLQVGKQTNQGTEISADVKAGRATTVKATYTHNNAKTDTASGKIQTALIPENQASLWVSHRFEQPLTVGLGARYNGSTVDETTSPYPTVDAYTLMDLMASYEVSRDLALRLNVRNLTDETYVANCSFYCYYGAARTVDLQLQYLIK